MANTTGSISQRAMLVSLTASNWSARKYDRKVSDEVAQTHGADRDIGRYNKQLIAKDALAKVNRAIRQIYATHYKYTLPWMDSGVRILGAEAYMDYATEMRRNIPEFEKAADEFAALYPQYINEQARRAGGLIDPSEYPATSVIRSKFNVSYAMYPMPDAADFRVSLGDAQLAAIKADMERTRDNAVSAAVMDVYGRITEQVGHMASRLRAYDNNNPALAPFRDSLVGNMADLVKLLPKLNITGDQKLTDLTQRIKNDLTMNSADYLRDSSNARNDVAAKAEAILAEVSEHFA